ncbi:chemotaxis protein CheW [Sutcliffiella rhizosphaerae]|uniref:Chemotaxis protein CheW n=1 Tax=Sutcliffiella rhizosphaerae TaxID=2880967 RepID=A0ABM8YNM0_9BACI|nr:chemotaxis protein CheW [Sutcliffiella rhizosphaerae]CAG9621495.1 Chemotaxis protein CheW [Sutcliffiella rhizosphaerae]
MESQKLVIFETNNEEYGIPVEFVISIEKLGTITALPEMPIFLKGIMKVRDQLIPVLDTKELLFSHSLEVSDKSRLILIETPEVTIGLLVEDAKEILETDQNNIKELNLMTLQTSAYIKAMVNLENRLIAMLDPRSLLLSLKELEQIKEAVENQQVLN